MLGFRTNLLFRLRPNQADYDCLTSCAYEKENDDSSNVWCFKPGAYKFSAECFVKPTGLFPYSISTKSTSVDTSNVMSTKSSTASYPVSLCISSDQTPISSSSVITSHPPTGEVSECSNQS